MMDARRSPFLPKTARQHPGVVLVRHLTNWWGAALGHGGGPLLEFARA